MARFLSDEWFEEVRRLQSPAGRAPAGTALVVEQVVPDTPAGEVRYRVVIGEGAARIEPTGNGQEPDLTITCDWSTAAAMAQGRLATQTALMEGRLRIRGNVGRLAGGHVLAGLDPVPAEVRAHTTY
jgi:hypothetical protein